MTVHPTAIVHPRAKLGRGVEIGPFCIVGENVEIGDGTCIKSHAVIEGWTKIGRDCQIGTGVLLGTQPQHKTYSGERSYVLIGDRNVLREYVTIHRAATRDGATKVGNDNFIMAFVHLGHDCSIGNGTTIANTVGFSGHASVDDYAVIGGITPIHQHVRIGAYAMVGGGSRVRLDIVPYALTSGDPLRIYGVNREGLRRNGFSAEQRSVIKSAMRVLFWSGLNVSAAVARLKSDMGDKPEVVRLIKFVEGTKRGLTPGLRIGGSDSKEEEGVGD